MYKSHANISYELILVCSIVMLSDSFYNTTVGYLLNQKMQEWYIVRCVIFSAFPC